MAPESFIHLRTHSYFSFLEGIPSPEELVKSAKMHGMGALGLTDHFGLTGAIDFYLACQAEKIKPVLGLELPVRHPFGLGELALFAMDRQGWGNLCKLSSLLQSEPHRDYSRGISWDQLSQHNGGLICLSGGLMGTPWILLDHQRSPDAKEYLIGLERLFSDRLYVELQIHQSRDRAIANQLSAVAHELGLPTVATHAIYYLEDSQAGLHQTITAMRLNENRSSLPLQAMAPDGGCFRSHEDMEDNFRDYPGSLEATENIADRCNLNLPLNQRHYPEIQLPRGKSAIDVLREKSLDGAKQIYGAITPEITRRLDHELNAIEARDYAPLFLIVEDIMDFANSNSVPVSSRGSAASSLVAHCLGITSPDPLALNLYFERFLNPERSSPPDIDIDLCSSRRNKVIEYVYRKYGDDRVAMVATINRFRLRSALREVAKAFGLPKAEIDNLVAQLPWRWWGPMSPVAQNGGSPYASVQEQFPSRRYQLIFEHAAALLDQPRHLSIHPGGIVISPDPINLLVPTQLASKGVIITQFDLATIERMGLLKIDLLGIRGLSVLGDVSEKIFSWRRNEYPDSLSVLEAIPGDDPQTLALVSRAQTIGCFQIESPGMRLTLREINATTQDDIMTALALYRPGPLTGGLKDAFVRRHLGQEEIEHLHPALEELLADTYGVILYQEQVLRIASELAGLSLADSDLLRRAMSHFDPGKRMETLKQHFIEGAYERNAVPPERGEPIWNLMAAFAGYGFPKAHAASYAQVAWRSAWCKAHYPAEFMAAVLANWGGYYSRRIYLNEARRLGVDIRPPHINHGGTNYLVAYPNGLPIIYLGFDQVRSLTKATQNRIISGRPYKDLPDFLTRVDPHITEAENLIKVGALRGMGTIPEQLDMLTRRGWSYRQPTLFELSKTPINAEEWTIEQRVNAQQDILGASIDAHPLELLDADIVNSLSILNSEKILESIGDEVRILGVQQTLQRVQGSQDESLYALEMEDLDGLVTVFISRDLYRRHRPILRSHDPLVVEGKVVYEQKLGEAVLLARKVQPFMAYTTG